MGEKFNGKTILLKAIDLISVPDNFKIMRGDFLHALAFFTNKCIIHTDLFDYCYSMKKDYYSGKSISYIINDIYKFRNTNVVHFILGLTLKKINSHNLLKCSIDSEKNNIFDEFKMFKMKLKDIIERFEVDTENRNILQNHVDQINLYDDSSYDNFDKKLQLNTFLEYLKNKGKRKQNKQTLETIKETPPPPPLP